MPRCEHKNIIVGSFQVGNVNAPVKLELDDSGEIVDFEFQNPMDRAGGELSDPVFYCADCGTEFETGSKVEPKDA